MFYYPAVLKRHTGCFSTIWLVATKGIRVPRRDFLRVNVIRTCDDIVNYLLERVPPPQPGLPRPRFSLYLSSQLQYGVVVVYHKQCAILLEELQSVVGRLVKQKTSQNIDMDDHSRQILDVPDALTLLEETEGARDPLFGVMYMQEAMPSPNTLIQMGRNYLRGTSPEHPEPTRPAAAAPDAALDSSITASPETITLRETEPVTIPAAEFEGEDLVDQHPETLDFLLAQADDFPEGEEEMEMEMERGGEPDRERTKEFTGSTLDLQPTTLSSEDAVLLPQEEPGLSVKELPEPPTDQLTPISTPILTSPPSQPPPPSSPPPSSPPPSSPPPSSPAAAAAAARERERPTLELEDVSFPEVRTRRRRRPRQLIFFDPETQLSQDLLQQQISDLQMETRRPPLLPPSSRRMLPAAELFNKPCTFLPEEVQFLWRRAAVVTPVSGSDLLVGERGPESTDSEREREREAAEAAEREVERPELSPKEVPRDLAESEMFDISGHGSLPLEGSDQREPSREISPMYTSEREGSLVSRSVSTLQDIPEVMDELVERETSGLLPELAEHEEEASVLFQSLLPPEVDRRTVSNIFHRLLEVLSAKKVHAEQDEPYGDIHILPGQNFEEEEAQEEELSSD